MTREEAETLAKNLWGEQGWADVQEGRICPYGVGCGNTTMGTGDSFDEAFEWARRKMERERRPPGVVP